MGTRAQFLSWGLAVLSVVATGADGADIRITRSAEGLLVLTSSGAAEDARVVFTLDGSEPTAASYEFTEPLPLPGPALVRAALVSESGEIVETARAQFDASRASWTIRRPAECELEIDFGSTLLVRGLVLDVAEPPLIALVCTLPREGEWACIESPTIDPVRSDRGYIVPLGGPVRTERVRLVFEDSTPVTPEDVRVWTVSWSSSEEAPGPPPEGTTWIPGGWFGMGSDDQEPVEGPRHPVWVDGFWMDTHEVTNAEFASFVEATGYETVAERPLDPADFPGVDPAMLKPGSMVFRTPREGVTVETYFDWWAWVPGASWKHPTGPGSSTEGLEDHPVVHVAWEDAAAYAAWAGRDLPTEAEWERAARGGHEGRTFIWGEEMNPGGGHPANVWQGEFPAEQLGKDGFIGTAPVGSFSPNDFGVHDMAGNVWEWCADWYRPDTHHRPYAVNPAGPRGVDSVDPQEPGLAKRVMRGGSFLCAENYCVRYRPSARTSSTPDSGMSHVGFRTVLRP